MLGFGYPSKDSPSDRRKVIREKNRSSLVVSPTNWITKLASHHKRVGGMKLESTASLTNNEMLTRLCREVLSHLLLLQKRGRERDREVLKCLFIIQILQMLEWLLFGPLSTQVGDEKLLFS